MTELTRAVKLVKEARLLVKGPKGKPPHPGLVWNEMHHRWMRPPKVKDSV